jgi:hypothetical protein
VYSNLPGFPTDDTMSQNWTIRIRLDADDLTDGTGSKIKLTLPHYGTDYTIEEMWIGVAASAGDIYDFQSSPTQVTFNGGATSITVTASDISDEITFSYDGSVDILISQYVDGVNGQPYVIVNSPQFGDNTESYQKASVNEASTVNVTGYSFVGGAFIYNFEELESNI